jgi:hypothetical protein
MKPDDFIHMPIPANMFSAVCALLGGAAAGALSAPKPGNAAASQDTAKSSATAETLAPANLASAGTGETATSAASPSDDGGEVDAHGHPWSADLHASTKGKTKDGLWRMKVGVSRPDPKPGFPVDEQSAGTGTSTETGTASATSQTAPAPADAPAATSGGEDDEFAAFRAAAATSDQVDQAAAASAPTARQWSDADLGTLCNQAAVKLGDPSPIKEIIAQYVPQGEVAHSRNIPGEKREDFAKAVEAKAGIEFAG